MELTNSFLKCIVKSNEWQSFIMFTKYNDLADLKDIVRTEWKNVEAIMESKYLLDESDLDIIEARVIDFEIIDTKGIIYLTIPSLKLPYMDGRFFDSEIAGNAIGNIIETIKKDNNTLVYNGIIISEDGEYYVVTSESNDESIDKIFHNIIDDIIDTEFMVEFKRQYIRYYNPEKILNELKCIAQFKDDIEYTKFARLTSIMFDGAWEYGDTTGFENKWKDVLGREEENVSKDSNEN